MGSLAQGKGTRADKALLELVLDNLSNLHGIPRSKLPPVVDHFAYDWYSDEFARGAFALFGPAQFGHANAKIPDEVPGSMFVGLKAPAARGKLHFAGEATSAHHAWVLGALNSAWRAVYNALDGRKGLQDKLVQKWGVPDEETEINLQALCELAPRGAF
jgi:monoamine oxidase